MCSLHPPSRLMQWVAETELAFFWVQKQDSKGTISVTYDAPCYDLGAINFPLLMNADMVFRKHD